MTKGVLMFAHNNQEIDYCMMAYTSAKYVEKYLKVPISLVTDSGTIKWLDKTNLNFKNTFDKIILTDDLSPSHTQFRRFHDGSIDYKKANFNNGFRVKSYEFSPYDKTLVIDTDVLIRNDRLKNIWNSNTDFMIDSKHIDILNTRNSIEFNRVSEYTVDFYWATIFYFEKTVWTKTLFDLCQHICENYEYYRFVYQIAAPLMRNDYVFSIAIHIMNGFNNKTSPQKLPANLYYTIDSDVLQQVTPAGDLVFLLQKEHILGEYTLAKTGNQNVHIMNKFSFNRNIPNLLEALDVN
jgi:hypothetical protein